MPFYIGDYLADTPHLTLAEHGAYMLLIFHYWRSGAPLLDDDTILARICRMAGPEWKRSRATIRAFFRPAVIDGDAVLTHTRIEKEMAEAGKRYDKQKERTEAARSSLQAKRDAIRASVTDTVTIPPKIIVTDTVTDSVTISKPQPQPHSPSEIVPEAKASGGGSAANGHDGKPAWWPKLDRYGRITGEITDKTLFDVGRAVLGRDSGGIITQARKAWSFRGHERDRTVAEFLLLAEEKSEPKAWFCGVLRKAEIDEAPHSPSEIYHDR